MQKDALLYLACTDTTVGFLSHESRRIDRAKHRHSGKHYIRTVSDLHTFKRLTRVPSRWKNFLRRAKRSSVILPNGNSFRIVHDADHRRFLKRLDGWCYSSSANRSGETYDAAYAYEQADVILYPLSRCEGRNPSALYRLGKKRRKRLR